MVSSKQSADESGSEGSACGLLTWASLFKNVRAIVLFDPSRPISAQALKWLKKKHRYRSVGVSARLMGALPPTCGEIAELLTDSPFVVLHHPFPQTERAVSLLGKTAMDYVMDSLILSCVYSAPLVVSDRPTLDRLKGVTTWQLKGKADFPEDEFIRHLRIASYAIIDFYDSAKEAFEAVRECARLLLSERRDERLLNSAFQRIDDLCTERRKQAREDGEKRFWRMESCPTGKTVAAYLDLLTVLRNKLPEMRPESLRLLTEEPCGLILPISAALCLPSSLT